MTVNKYKTNLYSRISPLGDPNISVVPVLDKWVEEGKKVRGLELQRIIRSLRTRNRHAHALQVLLNMTSLTNLPYDILTRAIIPKLLSQERGYVSYARLLVTCKYFNQVTLTEDVLKKVNFNNGKLFANATPSSYRALVEACAEAGNIDAQYLCGVSYTFVLGNVQRGLAILRGAYNLSFTHETCYEKEIRYAFGLVTFIERSNYIEGFDVFKQLFSDIGYNVGSYCFKLLQLLIWSTTRLNYLPPFGCHCTSEDNPCFSQCTMALPRTLWLYHRCCDECLAVREYNYFKRLLFNQV